MAARCGSSDPNAPNGDDQIGYAAAPLSQIAVGDDLAITCVDEKTNRESVDEVQYFDYYSSYYRGPGFANDSEPMAGFEPATYGLRRAGR